MSSKKSLNVTEIIERAKQALGIETDYELAELLEVTHSTIANWKRRGNINLIAIVTLCDSVDAEWLLFGKGTQENSTDPVTKKILTMLEGMDEEQKRDVLRYVKKEKLLEELLKKYDEKAA